MDVDVISSCEQTAADARVHRREAPQEIQNRCMRCIRILSRGQGCRVMSIVEMGQTGADHPETRDEQVPELRDGTKARGNRDGAHEDSRERTARSA